MSKMSWNKVWDVKNVSFKEFRVWLAENAETLNLSNEFVTLLLDTDYEGSEIYNTFILYEELEYVPNEEEFLEYAEEFLR